MMSPEAAVKRLFSAAVTGLAPCVQTFSATLHGRDCIVAASGDDIAARKVINAEMERIIAAPSGIDAENNCIAAVPAASIAAISDSPAVATRRSANSAGKLAGMRRGAAAHHLGEPDGVSTVGHDAVSVPATD